MLPENHVYASIRVRSSVQSYSLYRLIDNSESPRHGLYGLVVVQLPHLRQIPLLANGVRIDVHSQSCIVVAARQHPLRIYWSTIQHQEGVIRSSRFMCLTLSRAAFDQRDQSFACRQLPTELD